MLCQRFGRKERRSNLLFVGLSCLAYRSSGIRGMQRMGFHRIYIIQYSGSANKQIPHKNSSFFKESKGFFRKNLVFSQRKYGRFPIKGLCSEKVPQKRRESHPAGFRGAFCFLKISKTICLVFSPIHSSRAAWQYVRSFLLSWPPAHLPQKRLPSLRQWGPSCSSSDLLTESLS